MTTVSYVTTLYNKTPYLPYLLQGLASQCGAFERQFIFVDDGSTDDTVAALRTMTADWQNVVILQQENSGPAIAMNTGLAAVSGDYVKPMDGDDMLAPWATEYLLEALQKTDCQMAYSPRSLHGEYDLDHPFIFSPPSSPQYTHEADLLMKSLRTSQVAPAALLVQTDAIQSVGGCDPSIFIQDYSLELRLAATTRAARLDNQVFCGPRKAPGRLSDNEAQTLHDCNLAVMNLLRDYPELPAQIVQYALRRVSGRAWLWARRYGKKGYFSQNFYIYLKGRLGILSITPKIREYVCTPFRETFPIRFMN